MQWHMQAGSITTNIQVKTYFTFPELRATKIMTWNFHVNDSDKGKYGTILRRYLLTKLILNLKFSNKVIGADD